MRTLIITLALLFVVSASSFSQGTDSRFSSGVTHYAWAATAGPSTDSIHYIGRFFLRDRDLMGFDSLAFHITNADSVRYGVLVKGGGPLHTTDTVRVYTNDGAANAVHYVQKAAAGVTGVPWYTIRQALGDEAITAQYVDLYLIVYKVGTEVQVSNKKINVLPKAFQ